MSRTVYIHATQLDVSSGHTPPIHSAFTLRSTRWRVGPGCAVGGGPPAGPGCSLGRAARWAGLLGVPVGGGPPAQ